jgi:hypothetical protein
VSRERRRAVTEPADRPAPILVADFDVETGVPELRDGGGYETAWLVARCGGLPQAILEVDLRAGAPSLRDQLAIQPELGGADVVVRPEQRVAPDDELPRISVVIPSIIARTEDLDRCLAAVDGLDYPDFEVVLVDNRRQVQVDDPLPALIRPYRSVRVVRAPRPGISAARNAGVEAASGELVVFTDDDVRVDPQWLRALGRRFVAEPDLDAVTGLILPAELETPAQIWFERYYGGFSGQRTFAPLTLATGSGPLGRARVTAFNQAGAATRSFAVYGIGAYGAGANMAFRRRTLRQLGGFDLALGTGTPSRGGEDLAILIDVLGRGGRFGYEPNAIVHHQHRRKYGDLLHQLHGNGVGFTAMLTSVVVHDPRRLFDLLAQLPLAGQRLAKQSLSRLRGRQIDAEAPVNAYPRQLVLEELRGYPYGPLAYLRSRVAARRWSAQTRRTRSAQVVVGDGRLSRDGLS